MILLVEYLKSNLAQIKSSSIFKSQSSFKKNFITVLKCHHLQNLLHNTLINLDSIRQNPILQEEVIERARLRLAVAVALEIAQETMAIILLEAVIILVATGIAALLDVIVMTVAQAVPIEIGQELAVVIMIKRMEDVHLRKKIQARMWSQASCLLEVAPKLMNHQLSIKEITFLKILPVTILT